MLLAVGCRAPEPAGAPADAVRATAGQRLVDPAYALQDDWLHLPLKGRTDYRIAFVGDRLAIRAEGRESASALIRRVGFDPAACHWLEWSWRVDRLQPGADLSVKDKDDVAAALFLLFGDPGFLSDPDPVPTLRYVWTNGRSVRGAVLDNPHMPGVVRNLVLRNGRDGLAHWVTERRDLRADFEAAFSRPPRDRVRAIALFTDNDQTKEPVVAFYGPVTVFCDG